MLNEKPVLVRIHLDHTGSTGPQSAVSLGFVSIADALVLPQASVNSGTPKPKPSPVPKRSLTRNTTKGPPVSPSSSRHRIHFEPQQLEVLGTRSKTRETRFVTITPTLTEWLLPYRKGESSIIGADFSATLKAVKRKAGFTFGKIKPTPGLKMFCGIALAPIGSLFIRTGRIWPSFASDRNLLSCKLP